MHSQLGSAYLMAIDCPIVLLFSDPGYKNSWARNGNFLGGSKFPVSSVKHKGWTKYTC